MIFIFILLNYYFGPTVDKAVLEDFPIESLTPSNCGEIGLVNKRRKKGKCIG